MNRYIISEYIHTYINAVGIKMAPAKCPWFNPPNM